MKDANQLWRFERFTNIYRLFEKREILLSKVVQKLSPRLRTRYNNSITRSRNIIFIHNRFSIRKVLRKHCLSNKISPHILVLWREFYISAVQIQTDWILFSTRRNFNSIKWNDNLFTMWGTTKPYHMTLTGYDVK